MKWASLAKAQSEKSIIRFRVIYLMVGMGCLSTRWWMYYRWKRSWLAGLIQADSPLARNPKLVGLQNVASDFTVAVSSLCATLNPEDLEDFWPCCASTASGYLTFGWYFIDIPLTCVWWSSLETCKGIPAESSLLGRWVFICRYPGSYWGQLKRAQLQLGQDEWCSLSYTSANKIFYLVFLSSSVPWGWFSLFPFQWGLNVFLRFPGEKTGKALGSLIQLAR